MHVGDQEALNKRLLKMDDVRNEPFHYFSTVCFTKKHWYRTDTLAELSVRLAANKNWNLKSKQNSKEREQVKVSFCSLFRQFSSGSCDDESLQWIRCYCTNRWASRLRYKMTLTTREGIELGTTVSL